MLISQNAEVTSYARENLIRKAGDVSYVQRVICIVYRSRRILVSTPAWQECWHKYSLSSSATRIHSVNSEVYECVRQIYK